jgi:hypothetical protein
MWEAAVFIEVLSEHCAGFPEFVFGLYKFCLPLFVALAFKRLLAFDPPCREQ